MKISSINLNNFRNLSSVEIYPGPSVNFFVGRNGQGKTSVLEAICLLSTLKSFRDASPRQLISYGERAGEASLQLAAPSSDPGAEPWRTDLKLALFYQTAIDFERGGKATRLASINGKPSQSSVHYFSQRFRDPHLGVHSVVFNPSDHDLVRGDPSQRRSYVDKALCALDLEYLTLFQSYSRILTQRNTLLRSPQREIGDLLQAFTDQLAVLAAKIVIARRRWLLDIQEDLVRVLRQIAPDQSSSGLTYESHWAPEPESGANPGDEFEKIRRTFLVKIADSKNQELKCGFTRVGPHRDDWALQLGSVPLKGHGSQGEVRAALLALKIAELTHFRKQTGQTPLFLLDDFSSELDFERRNYLLTYLQDSDLQTFVTTTDDPEFKGELFRVSGGVVGK